MKGPRRAQHVVRAALLLLASRKVLAAPTIWVADDMTRVSPDRASHGSPLAEQGEELSLFALRGETVAFQVVVQADEHAVDGVSVDLPRLTSPAGYAIVDRGLAANPLGFTGRGIERFVAYAIRVDSRTRSARGPETIGWLTSAAMPPDDEVTGNVTDPLIPVEVAPSWAPYPLAIPRRQNRVVWFDITVPPEAPPGLYRGTMSLRAPGNFEAMIAVRLAVKDALLPERAARTAIFYDIEELRTRMGSERAEPYLWRLLYRHHLSPLLSINRVEDIARIGPALDGTAFLREEGYEGQGLGRGADVVALGAYGVLGDPTDARVTEVGRMVDALANLHGAHPELFLYAIDERCDSDRAARWKSALAKSTDPLMRTLGVAETCDQTPLGRAADLLMMSAAAYDRDLAQKAEHAGKSVWIYNGVRPRTGSLVLDAPPADLAANGWIAAAMGIRRWFYWESTFWNDDNRGGHGKVDPFSAAETFHNHHGDTALGDGVLLYPGRQLDFPARSIGFDGVIASIRLKCMRRGVEDAGYLALVAAQNPALAAALASDVVPRALSELTSDAESPSWPLDGRGFRHARRTLWEAVTERSALDREHAEKALLLLAESRRTGSPAQQNENRGVYTVAASSFLLLFVGWILIAKHKR